jgi:tetratricopeptide (TPR) repeat protein
VRHGAPPEDVGEQEEAIAQYRACIAAKPEHAEAYWSLANLKTFRFEQAEVAAMEALVRDGALPDEDLCMLHNALGLEYEARGDYDGLSRTSSAAIRCAGSWNPTIPSIPRPRTTA